MSNNFTALSLKQNTVILYGFESATYSHVVLLSIVRNSLTENLPHIKETSEVKSASFCWNLVWNNLTFLFKWPACFYKWINATWNARQSLGYTVLHYAEMRCIVFAVPSATVKQVWLNSIIWWGRQLCRGFGRALNITHYMWHWHTEYEVLGDWLSSLWDAVQVMHVVLTLCFICCVSHLLRWTVMHAGLPLLVVSCQSLCW